MTVSQVKKYVLGVDGGGTMTRCAVVDSEGIIHGVFKGGPSNPLTIGLDEALANIRKLIDNVSRKIELDFFDSVCFGIAGTERASMRCSLLKGLSETRLGKVLLVSDVKSAFTGAIPMGHGVVVVSGTGSIVYGLNVEGGEFRSGGWGWRVGDEGSSYSIGVECIRSVLKAFDGRGPSTLLTSFLTEELNLDSIENIIDWVYRSNIRPGEIASLAKLVGFAASNGDEVSQGILCSAGREIALTAEAVIEKLSLSGEFQLALSGGSFKLGTFFTSSFKEEIKKISPDCLIGFSRFPPMMGSAILALRNIEVEIGPQILENMEVFKEKMEDFF
jgi:N-acetylglucosamine kinase-like BadF-type ATPase